MAGVVVGGGGGGVHDLVDLVGPDDWETMIPVEFTRAGTLAVETWVGRDEWTMGSRAVEVFTCSYCFALVTADHRERHDLFHQTNNIEFR